MKWQNGWHMATMTILFAMLPLRTVAQQTSQQPNPPAASTTSDTCRPLTNEEISKWLFAAQEGDFKKIFADRMKQTLELLPKLHPELSAEDRNRLAQVLTSDKAFEDFERHWISAAQRHFSACDVREYLAYWEGPAGHKFRAEMPAVIQEAVEAWKADLTTAFRAQQEQDPAALPTSTTPLPSSEPEGCTSYFNNGVECIQLDQEKSHGMLVHQVAPTYPQMARAARIQGTVELKALIDKDGKIGTLEAVSGHPLLVPAAIEAVKQWQYKPFVLDGNPVEVEITIRVNFELANN